MAWCYLLSFTPFNLLPCSAAADVMTGRVKDVRKAGEQKQRNPLSRPDKVGQSGVNCATGADEV